MKTTKSIEKDAMILKIKGKTTAFRKMR